MIILGCNCEERNICVIHCTIIGLYFVPKSLYISCAVSNFYGTEIEIWLILGRFGADNEQLLRAVFS